MRSSFRVGEECWNGRGADRAVLCSAFAFVGGDGEEPSELWGEEIKKNPAPKRWVDSIPLSRPNKP
jgi:hypothetical protein